MISLTKPEGGYDTVINVAGVIVRVGDEILMIHRSADDTYSPNKWALPAGKVHDGETSQETAARELAEEVGIIANMGNVRHVAMFYHMYPDIPGLLVQFDVFEYSQQEKMNIIANEEVQATAWVTYEATKTYDLIDGEDFVFEHYFTINK